MTQPPPPPPWERLLGDLGQEGSGQDVTAPEGFEGKSAAAAADGARYPPPEFLLDRPICAPWVACQRLSAEAGMEPPGASGFHRIDLLGTRGSAEDGLPGRMSATAASLLSG